MNFPQRLAFIFVIILSIGACGDGGSSSGSGIGGTGITLVQGNVSSVNGQLFVYIEPHDSSRSMATLTKWIIPLSYAQSANPGSLTVSGGGQSATVNSSGKFELPNVAPDANFVLTFEFTGSSNIPLGIGEVLRGSTVTVKNIALDTKSGSAEPSEIEVEIYDDKEDDDSADQDGISADNPDDVSKDEAYSDDNIDDVSHDNDN